MDISAIRAMGSELNHSRGIIRRPYHPLDMCRYALPD
jgi:hypothetical protein